MKINEVMKETGLTKKAIYYYEEVGLIKPKKEEESNYRIYSEDDINILITIHTLRKLDFSIKDIQLSLSTNEDLKQALKKQLSFFNCEIERLNKSKVVLENFIEEGKCLNVNNIKLLIQDLEDGSKKNPGYMQKELDRILPGNLGKMFAIHYGQFLEEPLDTKKKEKAWHDLISFLDSQEDIQYPDDIKELIDKMFGKYSEGELLKLSEKTKKITDKILEGTAQVSDSIKSEMKVKIEEYKKTPQYQEELIFQKFTALNLAPIFKEVDKYVSILSIRFDKYNKILKARSENK